MTPTDETQTDAPKPAPAPTTEAAAIPEEKRPYLAGWSEAYNAVADALATSEAARETMGRELDAARAEATALRAATRQALQRIAIAADLRGLVEICDIARAALAPAPESVSPREDKTGGEEGK